MRGRQACSRGNGGWIPDQGSGMTRIKTALMGGGDLGSVYF